MRPVHIWLPVSTFVSSSPPYNLVDAFALTPSTSLAYEQGWTAWLSVAILSCNAARVWLRIAERRKIARTYRCAVQSGAILVEKQSNFLQHLLITWLLSIFVIVVVSGVVRWHWLLSVVFALLLLLYLASAQCIGVLVH